MKILLGPKNKSIIVHSNMKEVETLKFCFIFTYIYIIIFIAGHFLTLNNYLNYPNNLKNFPHSASGFVIFEFVLMSC